MGVIYKVTCKSCGYGDQVKVGGSMATFETDSPFPVLCHQCKKISRTNAKSGNDPSCSGCGGSNVTVYGAATLGTVPSKFSNAIGTEPFSTDSLTVGPHRCPQCDESALTFRSFMRFD